jgi:DNA-binding CsgD family transcriptional regulator/tetratricopeptide (TPR) repeat protein
MIQGLPEATARTALVEATDQRILVAQGRDTCWFRHPLLAEVLGDTIPPGAAVPIHAAWAATLEQTAGTGIDEVRRQGDLARHYEAANDLAAGLRASLEAARLAQEIKAPHEAAVHLRRAAGLWPVVHRDQPDVAGEVRLMEDLARASHLIGDGEASIAAWSRALELVDEDSNPLYASHLMVEWSEVAYELARFETPPIEVALRAVQLSEPYPDSPEYSVALSNLGSCEIWSNQLAPARGHAEAALRAARRTGDSKALCIAFGLFSFLDRQAAEESTRAGQRYAQLTGDPELIAGAAVSRYHHFRHYGNIETAIRTASEGLRAALNSGAVQGAVRLAGCLARSLLISGRLADSDAVIREGLALVGVRNASAAIRLTAALLATRRGDLAFAQLHLDRAGELIPNLDSRPGMMAPPLLAECLLATRQAERALDLLERTLPVQSLDPRVVDEMLMWGARAAAELAQDARDHHDDRRANAATERLDELVALRDSLPHRAFEPLVPGDPIQPALEALFVAESKRARGDSGTSVGWEEAVRRCEAAGMRWEQMISTWRWAQALLREGTQSSVVAPMLRAVHQFATAAGARPLQLRAVELASLAKISLEEPVGIAEQVAPPAALAGLTKRELEVLSHLVAGRTYAEIGGALFISEKTVSVHVSNLLRKTGTSSRQEVSALALRLRNAPG